jgi:hypothetical protein
MVTPEQFARTSRKKTVWGRISNYTTTKKLRFRAAPLRNPFVKGEQPELTSHQETNP